MARCTQSVLLAAFLYLAVPGRYGTLFAQSSPSTKSSPLEERNLLDAAKRDPNNLQVIGSLGEFYLRHERWHERARWLGKAYALSGGDASTGDELALVQMNAGDFESAKQQIEKMLAQRESAKLHALLAEVDDKRGAYLDAAREYHRAAEMEPSESNIFDLGTFLLQHKKYVGALNDSIKFFRYGVAQFPQSSQMMVGLGVALYAANDYDEAVRVLCAAVDLDPKDQRPVQFLGRASRVSPELAQQVDNRLKVFAERDPDNAAMNYFYALSLWERGGGQQGRNLEKIEQLLLKAETLSPDWYEPHYQLGVMYELEQKNGRAIDEMKRAVGIDPDFFPAHFRLAVLYNKVGDKGKAMIEASSVKRLKERENEDETTHDVTR